MKNIILSYGKEEKKESWMNYFDEYYFIQHDKQEITNKEIKKFLKDELLAVNGEDNFFIIYNELLIDKYYFEETVDYITNDILKDKFCYLFNYMQVCSKLNKTDKLRKYDFYATDQATEFYAVAAKFKLWYNLLLDKDFAVPLYLKIQEKLKDKVVYAWPNIFQFGMNNVKDNFLLASPCRENFNPIPLKPYNNRVAKIIFILTISLIFVFFYFFWRKIPKNRYFQVKTFYERK